MAWHLVFVFTNTVHQNKFSSMTAFLNHLFNNLIDLVTGSIRLEELDAATMNKRLEADEVTVKFLAAPFNPSDFNIVSLVSIALCWACICYGIILFSR